MKSDSSRLWKQFELQVSLLLEECRQPKPPAPLIGRGGRLAAKSASRAARPIASRIDHTLLKPDATRDEITEICAQAVQNGFATVCVHSHWLPEVSKLLKGSRVKPIAVVGFPHGAGLSQAKAAETTAAIRAGAREIDMVINIGRLKSREFDYVLKDIAAVVKAAGKIPVKVILETSLLTDAEKVAGAVLSQLAGAAFVKTSTGFSGGGATVEDIRLIRSVCAPSVRVKASGGIRTHEIAVKLIEAGADRLGASASVAIVNEAGTPTSVSLSKPRDY